MFNIKEELKEIKNNPHFQTPEEINVYVKQLEKWNEEEEVRISKLDDTKVYSTEWWLKGDLCSANVWSNDNGQTGGYIQDFKTLSRSIVTVGTEKQQYFMFSGLQIRDSWRSPLSSNYKQLYLQNNKQGILINLI